MRGDLKLAGKRVSVLGAGRTGQAVIKFLTHQKSRVFASDSANISRVVKAEWGQWKVDWEEGAHSERLLDADLIIPSPGVPADHPILVEASARKIPVLSEIEVAYQFCGSDKLLAVTGTVGKTTTTHLVSKLLENNKYHVITAGNIGRPFISCLDQIGPDSVVVLEVSSYQLEHIQSFKPHIGVFTRFAPHHLHRHGSVEKYFQLKCNLFKNQDSSDYAVVQEKIELPSEIRSRITHYSANDIALGSQQLAYHQLENLAGALKAVQQFDPSISLRNFDIENALKLPHRIEYVTELNGVRFINDSKATSPEATEAALDALHENSLVLILGGQDSEGDALGLTQQIEQHGVERVLLVGETRDRFSRLFQKIGFTRYESVRDLSEAINISLRIRPKVCLFSPGSPSFDQFKNYEERGEFFKSVLKRISQKT